ncbi:hypothetical protein ACLBWX_08440 [Methylobacterium sp. M6A4_1b]
MLDALGGRAFAEHKDRHFASQFIHDHVTGAWIPALILQDDRQDEGPASLSLG